MFVCVFLKKKNVIIFIFLLQVSEQTVTFECKGATNRNLTVICCIDVGFASTLISNVEIICLKQRLAPSSVSAKPKEKLVSLLKRLSKQTQYFKVVSKKILGV